MLGTFVCSSYAIIELYHYICNNSHLGHINRELGRDCGKTPIPVICSFGHSNNFLNGPTLQLSKTKPIKYVNNDPNNNTYKQIMPAVNDSLSTLARLGAA